MITRIKIFFILAMVVIISLACSTSGNKATSTPSIDTAGTQAAQIAADKATARAQSALNDKATADAKAAADAKATADAKAAAEAKAATDVKAAADAKSTADVKAAADAKATADAATKATADALATEAARPTATPVPTETPVPTATNTPLPTDTPAPTQKPVTFAEFDTVLRDNGYSRDSFKGIGTYTNLRPGKTGYIYINNNAFEPIKAYTDGYVRLEVLNDPKNRASHMEQKLKVLDTLFPAEFMAELRKANDAYLQLLPDITGISGDANQLWPPPNNDPWKSLEGQYHVSNTTIGPYPVANSLWFWQITCPAGYICWFPSFRSEVWIGQNSLTFYDIEITIAP